MAQSDTGPVTMRPPAMAKLDGLVGRWTGTVTSRLEGEHEVTVPFKSSFRWILRDYHLQGTLEYVVNGRTYEATLLWSYDRAAAQYTMIWLHNFSSDSVEYRGTVRNGVIELESRYREGGRDIFSSLRWKIDPPNQWTAATATGPEGDIRSRTTLTAKRSK